MPNPDYTLKEQFDRAYNQNLARQLATGGSGPHDPGMEARVAKLESGIADIKATLGRLEPAITKIRDDVVETKGRVAQMPTTVQLIALVLGIFATAFALLKLTVHP